MKIPTIPQLQPQPSNPQIPQVQYQQPTQVIWTQGFDGAKGVQLIYPNTEVYIRDTEDLNVMYIKTANSFEKYNLEKVEIETPESQFVTRDELTATLESMFQKYMSNQPKNRQRNNKGGVNNASE